MADVKVASSDFGYPGLSPEFLLDLMVELGIDGVSIGLFPGRSNWPLDEIAADPQGMAERIRTALAARDLGLSDVFHIPARKLTELTVNHPDAAQREESERLFAIYADFAAAVGSTGITLPPGLVFGGESWEAAANRASENLSRRIEIARERGLRCSVEPHILSLRPYSGSLIDTPAKTLELIDRTPGLELTLDYGHYTVQGIPDREIEPLLDHTRHFHVRGADKGLVQTRFEDNVVDYGRAIDRLCEIGYDGWIEVEQIYDQRPGCSNCDNIQELRKWSAYVRERLGGNVPG
jgi:sugar phosphate isomerase/epimerase